MPSRYDPSSEYDILVSYLPTLSTPPINLLAPPLLPRIPLNCSSSDHDAQFHHERGSDHRQCVLVHPRHCRQQLGNPSPKDIHNLLTHPINTSCQHTLSIHSRHCRQQLGNLLTRQHIALPTHPLNPPSQSTLPTHPINKHFLQKHYQQVTTSNHLPEQQQHLLATTTSYPVNNHFLPYQ